MVHFVNFLTWLYTLCTIVVKIHMSTKCYNYQITVLKLYSNFHPIRLLYMPSYYMYSTKTSLPRGGREGELCSKPSFSKRLFSFLGYGLPPSGQHVIAFVCPSVRWCCRSRPVGAGGGRQGGAAADETENAPLPTALMVLGPIMPLYYYWGH